MHATAHSFSFISEARRYDLDLLTESRRLILLQNIAVFSAGLPMCLVCAFLGKEISCPYGNLTPEYFGVDPSALQDYFILIV